MEQPLPGVERKAHLVFAATHVSLARAGPCPQVCIPTGWKRIEPGPYRRSSWGCEALYVLEANEYLIVNSVGILKT